MKEFTSKKSKFKVNLDKDKTEVTLSCVILLFLWQIIALAINNDIYLPTIQQVLKSIKEIILQERFYIDITLTTLRTLVSFFISLILAIIIGVLGNTSRRVRNFFRPINSIFKSIPMMILIVLSLIWFNKNSSPYIIGIITVFPILYESVLGSISSINKELIEMMNIYDITLKDKILKVYFPNIKFRVISILSSTISLVLKVVIAGEIYGQPNYGIGSIIQVEKMNFNTPAIFAWLIIIILMCRLIDLFQTKILRSTFVWKKEL